MGVVKSKVHKCIEKVTAVTDNFGFGLSVERPIRSCLLPIRTEGYVNGIAE